MTAEERRFDFRPFEEMYPEWEERFCAGPETGAFSYKKGGPASLYGCTDIVISRFIMNRLDLDDRQKDEWAGLINSFQKPGSGWYRKKYTLHFRAHSAAYATSALKLLGRSPRYENRKATRISRSAAATGRWLARVPWSIIWPGSHEVAGLPAIRVITRGVDDADTRRFMEDWKNWLDERVHPDTGFWSRGLMQRLGLRPLLAKEELGGAFHLMFMYETMGWEWPLPEKVVDSVLMLQNADGLWSDNPATWIDLDGIYCLTRSSRNASGYRKADVKDACVRFLSRAEDTLNDRAYLFRSYENSHGLPGAMAGVAECAKFYPDLVKSSRPWRQSLDYACFI